MTVEGDAKGTRSVSTLGAPLAETAASVVALGPTGLIPGAATDPATAWSLDELDEPPERKSWRSTNRSAAGVRWWPSHSRDRSSSRGHS